MSVRVSIFVVLIVFGAQSIHAGDDNAKARLKDLQTRVVKQEFDNDKLRRELLTFAREQVGMSLYAPTMEALRATPSPFDKLDEKAIDAEDRKFLSIGSLVGYIRPHGRAVAHVAISFDGAFLATSGWDNLVHIHKLGGKEPTSWAKIEGSMSGIAFSPDSKLLATGCRDSRLLVWDITGDKPVEKESLQGHKSRPFAVAFSPKGKTVASGSLQPVLRVSKLNDPEPTTWGEVTKEKASLAGASSLAFSHDGKHLVAGSLFGKDSLRVWDVGGAYLDDKLIPGATARLIACAPTAPIIAFAGDDAEIHLWNFSGAKIEKLHKLSGHEKKGLMAPVKALAFSADGELLASAGQDKRVRIWDVKTGEKLHEWHFLDEARALAFASDSRHLAVGNGDGTLYLLRLASARIKVK